MWCPPPPLTLGAPANRSRLLLPFVLTCAVTIITLGVLATTVPMAPALLGAMFGLELAAIVMLAAVAAAAGFRAAVGERNHPHAQ